MACSPGGDTSDAVVNQHKGNNGQDQQFGINHEVFQFTHALDTPDINHGEDQNRQTRHDLAHPSRIANGKPRDGVGRKGLNHPSLPKRSPGVCFLNCILRPKR